ncbi:MAG: S8 family serine peptidase [Anaerolineae bacterium]|nr:S8 family serine peptidase [Anaerolineae bacterium]
MGEMEETKRTGCGQAIVIVLLLSWLVGLPLALMGVAKLAPGEVISQTAITAIVILLTAAGLLLPFAGVALATRRRVGWRQTTAVAAALTAIAGYVVLDAGILAALPHSPNWVSALRLSLLVPYALLAAWLTPRLAGASSRRLREWLGLTRFDRPAFLLALAVAALVTILWPVTGALGDSLTSLGLVFQTFSWALPQVLLIWGLVFLLLTSTFTRPWVAALVTISAYYGLFVAGGVLSPDVWSALRDIATLLPLGLLLTELRARESGIYPLLLVAFCYRVAPFLFVDPRDAIAQGIPEPQHILSHTIVIVTTTALGVALWGGRKLLTARVRMSRRARVAGGVLAALLLCGAWSGLYVFTGEPGFANDGFLIILNEQADLSAAHAITDREARLQYVYETLVETAERTQSPLRTELDELGVSHRSYYIINMIRVDGHRWLKRRFEGRPGVAQVILNPNVREYPYRIPFPYGGDTEPPAGVQPNLTAIHADEAWALGVTGEGIVVAGQDTGYDWTHPALKPHYRGWNGTAVNHDYNWHDAWDDTAAAFDDDSHGTHTMGIVLGDDGGQNHTGVAPGAQWIGCRNMRRGFGNPASYAECMEFFLAPYLHDGDPFTDGDVTLAPHAVNNSWGCPDIEGCFPDTLEPAVEALRAAGIMMVVSAGNDGPACSTATTPPANYDAVFSVGATSNGGHIVGFSSRGPVDGLVKPDVTAPGDYVRSSVPGGGYGYAGGTSMAGPHVAGLVALLWSANLALVGDIDATEALICQTAAPKPVESLCTIEDEVPEGPFAALLHNPICACGDVIGVPNNVYGCGFIDAGAAVQAALGRTE